MARWHAQRASGLYLSRTVVDTLNMLGSHEFVQRIGLSPHTPGLQEPDEEESELCRAAFRFACEIASNRAWSQNFLTSLLPWMLSTVFLPTQEEREAASERMQRVAAAMIGLETEIADGPTKELQALWADIGVLSWPWTRELIQYGESVGWDCSDSELRDMAYLQSGGPSETKSTLENVFGWLRDSSERHSKSRKMSPFTRHLYCLSCPYCEAGGCEQIRPTRSDLLQYDPTAAQRFLQQRHPYAASAR